MCLPGRPPHRTARVPSRRRASAPARPRAALSSRSDPRARTPRALASRRAPPPSRRPPPRQRPRRPPSGTIASPSPSLPRRRIDSPPPRATRRRAPRARRSAARTARATSRGNTPSSLGGPPSRDDVCGRAGRARANGATTTTRLRSADATCSAIARSKLEQFEIYCGHTSVRATSSPTLVARERDVHARALTSPASERRDVIARTSRLSLRETTRTRRRGAVRSRKKTFIA